MPNEVLSAAALESRPSARSLPRARPGLRDLVADFERSLIVAALLAARGNQRQAAWALGVLPTTLQEKLKRLGLSRPRRSARGPHRKTEENQ